MKKMNKFEELLNRSAQVRKYAGDPREYAACFKPLTFEQLQLLERRFSHIPEVARAIESELRRRKGQA